MPYIGSTFYSTLPHSLRKYGKVLISVLEPKLKGASNTAVTTIVRNSRRCFGSKTDLFQVSGLNIGCLCEFYIRFRICIFYLHILFAIPTLVISSSLVETQHTHMCMYSSCYCWLGVFLTFCFTAWSTIILTCIHPPIGTISRTWNNK